MSCVVQRDNFRDLIALAQLARSWGVRMNFSTYTWLRTEDKNYMLTPDDLPELRAMAGRLMEFRRAHDTVTASPWVFDHMAEFFRQGRLGGCRAGERFLIVNPDGTLSPCGLIQTGCRTVAELRRTVRENHGACADCYTSIRANSEKPLWNMAKDALRVL